VTNAGCCSWHELASAVFELSGLQTKPIPISSAEFGAAARRPGYSVLGGNAFKELGLPPIRPWREALASYLEEKGKRGGKVPAVGSGSV
jgi:dTDP-4-dehydrorhamnose reductase